MSSIKSVNEMLIDIGNIDAFVYKRLSEEGSTYAQVQPIYDLLVKKPLTPDKLTKVKQKSNVGSKVSTASSIFRGYYNSFTETHDAIFRLGGSTKTLTNCEAKILQSLLMTSLGKSEKLLSETMALFIQAVQAVFRAQTFWALSSDDYYGKQLVKEIRAILVENNIEQPVEAKPIRGKGKVISDDKA